MKPHILLLSAYHADSHAAWVNTLVEGLSEFEWTVLTLPPRYFSWRVRGNSLSWAFGESKAFLERRYDLVLATSMVDLSALRGFCPALATTPTLVYFHENQFAYPSSGKEFSSVEPQLLSLYTALCGDKLLFNSGFNRDSFIEGVKGLLKRLPDQVPPGLIDKLTAKAEVLPVPVRFDAMEPLPRKPVINRPVRLVWSARWEFDKGPDRLLFFLNELTARSIPFELALLGQSFRKVPEAFDQIAENYASQLVQFGYAETRAAYIGWLDWADIVISTSLHEFQGLAVIEAVTRGAYPLMPDRQVYPELFSEIFIYDSDLVDLEREARSAATQLERLCSSLAAGQLTQPDLRGFDSESLLPRYRAMITSMLA